MKKTAAKIAQSGAARCGSFIRQLVRAVKRLPEPFERDLGSQAEGGRRQQHGLQARQCFHTACMQLMRGKSQPI